jgi:hypothetical protein
LWLLFCGSWLLWIVGHRKIIITEERRYHASVRFCAPFLALVFAVGFISSSEVEWLFHICRRQGFYPYSGSPRLVGLMREKHREQQDLQHPVEA